MKRFLFASLSLALLGWAQIHGQTVRTVDNNPGGVAQYTSLTAAYNDAEEGDIILITPSATEYWRGMSGNVLNVYKKNLHFVGYGDFLGTNSVPGLSTQRTEANINFKFDISLGDGSGGSVTGIRGGFNSDPGTTGIVIDKCFSTGASWRFQGDVTVTRCFHRGDIRFDSTNSTIRNSFMSSFQMYAANSSMVNCVILNSIRNRANQTIQNTIFLENVSTTRSSFEKAADITYCMHVGRSELPDNGTNINGALLTNVFTLTGGANNVDRYYVLKEGSDAIDQGLGGVDMGIFGGPDAYVLGMVPGRPRLTRFDVPLTATGLTEFTFEVEAQAFAE